MLEILYRDDVLVAVNKPSGLLVHRSVLAGDRVTCLTIVRDMLGQWVWPVHRLDRGASGVLLFALDPDAAALVAAAFAGRTVDKEYVAIVRGWAPERVEVDYPLDDDEVRDSPRVPAQTTFELVGRVELRTPVGRYPTARYSLVRAEPHTGRRHQIRRHLAHLRHPIIGDAVHGDGAHNRFFRETYAMHRLLLHGLRLRLEHPHGGALSIVAPPPDDLAELAGVLGWREALELLSVG
jgi:tRNA pseudouridine65 synthase